MFFSFPLIFIMSFTSYLCKEFGNRNYNIKNTIAVVTSFSAIVAITLVNLIDYNDFTFKNEEFIFLKDPLIYLMSFMLILNNIALRKFCKNNESNLTYISLTNFLFLSLIPIVSVFCIYLFDFDTTLNTKYSSIYETIATSLILMLLSFLFFLDKLKSKSLHRIDLMIISLILSSFSFVLMNKLMQVYSAPSVYVFSLLFSFTTWSILSYKKKEYKEVKKENLWIFPFFIFQYIMYSYINIILVDMIPTEHIAVLRSVFGVFSAFLLDSFIRKKSKMPKKDILVLLCIFTVIFFLDF